MGKKSSISAAPKLSSSSALATTSASATSSRSSILKSAFTPSHLQLRLFASVIHSFESQQLRIHDVSSGRLQQSHSVPAGVEVSCLDWGCYGPSYRLQRSSSKKKRKRSDENLENMVVGYGTSKGEICMFSPAEGKIVGSLKGGHARDIKDFKFTPEDNLEAWSIGGDGKLVQWNLRDDLVTRSISLPDSSVKKLCLPSLSSPQILCASVHPFAIEIETKDDFRIESFNAFKDPVHTLIRSGVGPKSSQETFLAADRNRHMNVYDIHTKEIVRTLVSKGDIESAEIHRPISSEDEVLAIVTGNGAVELFSTPFLRPQVLNGDLKSKRKSATRKADAIVRLADQGAVNKDVPVHAVFFDGPNLVIVSIDRGVEPVFQKLRWQDEGSGSLLFEGMKEVTRAKSSSSLNATTVNGAKDMGLTHLNDARTVVVNGLAEPGSQVAPVEIESSEDGESEDNEEADMQEDATATDPSEADSNVELEDVDADLEGTTAGGEGDTGEPSFGDLLAARHPEAISVIDSLPVDQNASTKALNTSQGLSTSGMSLGTVLTQALRTNDQSLLETCLHVTDEHIIQNTILRLESSLAANLLIKLAERLADRPGRYGHLLTWVQATMIAHGGAIASQAGVASKLRTLYQVLNERSKILPSILLLKGKLDMMSAQQSFRAQAEAHRKGALEAPVTTYIEGQEDNWSSEEDEGSQIKVHRGDNLRSNKALQDLVGGKPESSEDEDMDFGNRAYESDDAEESDLDDGDSRMRNINGAIDNEADISHESDSDGDGTATDSDEEDDNEDEEESEDSSMADFINDGEISVDEDDMEDDPQEAAKERSRKKSRRER